MGLSVEIESALSYGGLFTSPGNLNDAKAWLAAEQRRHGLLQQTYRMAESAHGAEGAAPHAAALEESTQKVAWLTQLVADLSNHNERIAPMKFSLIDYLMEPVLLFTGGYKKWFEKK